MTVGRPTEPVLDRLAEFVASASVPPGPQHAARRTIANAACLVVGSARAPAVEAAASLVEGVGSAPQATILGRPGAVAVPYAAFVMGIAAHIEDFDHTHLRTIIHPGAPVPPAAIALAERFDLDTGQLTEAVAVGVEVMLRIGNGMSPSHFERGWHMTATLGHVGASATGSRLLGLDGERTTQAIGLALQQAVLGTMAKSFHPGRAAMDGCEAALLAAQDWSSPRPILEGPEGFAAQHSDDADLDEMLVDLGEHWELETNAFKPYSCGIVAHPLIDAGIALREEIDDPKELGAVAVRANPWVLVAMGLEEPSHRLESKFSAYHAMAAGYLLGRAGPPEFSTEVALDPDVIAVRRRITIVAGEQLREKGRRELERTLDADRADELLEALFDTTARPVRDVVALATP